MNNRKLCRPTGGRNRAVAYWDLDPNNLPVVAPSEAHTRMRTRVKSERAFVHADDAGPIVDAPPSAAETSAPQPPAAQSKN